MAAEYSVKVRCHNCGVTEDRTFHFGTEVCQSYCNNCGCKSLSRIGEQNALSNSSFEKGRL